MSADVITEHPPAEGKRDRCAIKDLDWIRIGYPIGSRMHAR